MQEKRDNKKQTGSGGGRAKVLDDNDSILLDIIGNESPVLDGLPVAESSGTDRLAELIREYLPDEDGDEIPDTAQPPPAPTPPIRPSKKKTLYQTNLDMKRRVVDDQQVIRDKKKVLLDVETYKRKLEVLELEKRLGLEPSDFTREIRI